MLVTYCYVLYLAYFTKAYIYTSLIICVDTSKIFHTIPVQLLLFLGLLYLLCQNFLVFFIAFYLPERSSDKYMCWKKKRKGNWLSGFGLYFILKEWRKEYSMICYLSDIGSKMFNPVIWLRISSCDVSFCLPQRFVVFSCPCDATIFILSVIGKFVFTNNHGSVLLKTN